MGDKIVVMNHGVVEQFGAPQDIYDKPATMFVADFIGSPSMNFLRFKGNVRRGASEVDMDGIKVEVPVQLQACEGDLVLGVRPEHVKFSDTAAYRGEIVATEYLGTTQIVTLKTANGNLKARIEAALPARVGELIGLSFNAKTLTLFDAASSRAIRSELNDGVLGNG